MSDARADLEALTFEHYEALRFGSGGDIVIHVDGAKSAAWMESLRQAFHEQAGMDVTVRHRERA